MKTKRKTTLKKSIMDMGQILPVSEYNRRDMNKWHEDVEKWKGNNSNQIIPQVAFRGFRSQKTGELKKHGFVARVGADHFRFAKTKKELNKEIKKLMGMN